MKIKYCPKSKRWQWVGEWNEAVDIALCNIDEYMYVTPEWISHIIFCRIQVKAWYNILFVV